MKMGEKQNKELVERIYKSLLRGDTDVFLGALSEDIEWIPPGPEYMLPWAGKRRGRRQVAEFYRVIDETLDIQELEIEEIFTEGNQVVVLGHEVSRIRSNDRTFEIDWIDVLTLRDGQVVRYRNFYDTALVAEAVRGS